MSDAFLDLWLAVAGGVRQAARGGHRAGWDGVARRRGFDALARGRDHGLVGETELLVQHRVRGAGAVVGEAYDPARVADELAPAHRDAGLDAHPGPHGRRQHLVLVRLV